MSETATLLGSQYEELGEIGVADLGSDIGLAISRGRFPKGYPHTDPNEDAALAMRADSTAIAVVADGHNGFDAALSVVELVGDQCDELLGLTTVDPARAVSTLLERSAAAVSGLSRPQCGTALSVVAVNLERGAAGTFGDTTVLLARGGKACSLTSPTDFLRSGEPPQPSPSIAGFAVASADRVVLATDGVRDFAGRFPERAIANSAAGEPPIGAARALIELGFAGGAGDNLAAVVMALPRP